MRARELLEALHGRGLRLSACGDHLRVEPRSRVKDADRELIRSHKPALLVFLQAEARHEAFEERAAILEFDGGLTRADAEATARHLTA